MDKLMEKTVKANLGCIYNSAPLVKYHITQMKRCAEPVALFTEIQNE